MNTDVDTNGSGPGLMVELFAKIDAHIGAVHDLAKELRKPPPKPKKLQQPVFGRAAATGIFATGIPLVLKFNNAGPDQGHFWYIRSIVIGGLSPTVTAAGRADVFVSASDLRSISAAGSLASVGLADWRDQAATLPDVSFYGRGELPLRLNEELFVVITAATNAQQYVAAIQYEDFEEGTAELTWGE